MRLILGLEEPMRLIFAFGIVTWFEEGWTGFRKRSEF